MDFFNLIKENSNLNGSLLETSLTSRCFPYIPFQGEDGKHPKNVSKGGLLVECKYNFHPRSLDSSDCNELISFSLLSFSHISMDGKL